MEASVSVCERWRPGDQFPTTSIERYLARPAHGDQMVFSLTFTWLGELNIATLKTAWQKVIETNVRTRSTMIGRGRRQRWRVDSITDLSKHFVVREEPYSPANSYVAECQPNVRHGIGANFLVWKTCDGKHVTRFQFHHACCDGLGASRFVAETFKSYQRQSSETANKQADVRERNPKEENGPGSRIDTASSSLNSKPAPTETIDDEADAIATLPDWRNTWTTIRGKNLRLKSHLGKNSASHGELSDKRIRFESLDEVTTQVRFDSATSQRIRRWLKRQKIPMNDFGVAVTLASAADIATSSGDKGERVMVMNPVQHRGWAQRRDTSNHIGFAYIRRKLDELNHIESVVRSVHEELDIVRTNGIYRELAWGMEKLEYVPSGLAIVERIGWFTPTASLTCLSNFRLARRFGFVDSKDASGTGKTIGVNGPALDEISGIGPLQARGELAVTILDVGDTLTAAFRGHRNRSSKREDRQRGMNDAKRSPNACAAIGQTKCCD